MSACPSVWHQYVFWCMRVEWVLLVVALHEDSFWGINPTFVSTDLFQKEEVEIAIGDS